MRGSTRTVTFVVVGLAIILIALLLLGGVSKASTIDDNTTSVAAPSGFAVQADAAPSRSGAHCWEITLDQRLVAVAGPTQAWPAVEAMWCSGKNYAKVTDLVYFHCFSKGGFYSYDGCGKDVGKVGYPYLGASAHWHYHWIINGVVFDKTPNLTARFYANGQVTGTWYWHTT
jgi:hypothetical protein